MGFELQQRQVQVQILSQRQIQSLKILSMGNEALREAVLKAAEENPMLSLKTPEEHPGSFRKDWTRFGSATKDGSEAADRFQKTLEAQADNRESLQSHLLSQLNMTSTTETEHTLCEKIIGNLDEKGFHILAPVSLLDRKDRKQTAGLLEKCISIIRQFEPSGVCVTNMEESLYVQAQQKENPPPLAMFILDGKFSFLDPPQPDRILKKIRNHISSQKKLFAQNNTSKWDSLELTEESVENALLFIRSLDPFPARNYSTADVHYVSPDIFVEPYANEDSDLINGRIVSVPGAKWKVTSSYQGVPELVINMDALPEKGKPAESSENLRKAREFIENIQYRQDTIMKASCIIVEKQSEFFRLGPGHLVPLRQQDVADLIGVHETTISRMASSKYVQCEWGLFDIKYFFTNKASTKDPTVSRDKVLHAMKEIIGNESDGKKMSDRLICERLSERGISISRRTVAKYRGQLNIDSSYNRR